MSTTDTPKLARIAIAGLHGRLNIEHTFLPGLNILHAKNGVGKTTLLHIIANILNGDFARLAHLRFATIEVQGTTGSTLVLSQDQDPAARAQRVTAKANGKLLYDSASPPSDDNEVRAFVRATFGGRPVYLPAFRMVLESLSRKRRELRPPYDEMTVDIRQLIDQEVEEERSRNIDAAKAVGIPYQPRYRVDAVERARSSAIKTALCREWFGELVPTIRFPSLLEVEAQLQEELTHAQLVIAETDRRSLSEVFQRIVEVVVNPDKSSSSAADGSPRPLQQSLAALRGRLEQLETTRSQVPEIYTNISEMLQGASDLEPTDANLVRSVLDVYSQALGDRLSVQSKAYAVLEQFERSVNLFLSPEKELLLSGLNRPAPSSKPRQGRAPIVEESDGRGISLSQLSSGERHVITLLFSVTHMSHLDGAVLVDEPELSLHVDWQRLVMSEIQKQAAGRQIIACTHAPEIAADHLDSFCKLSSTRWHPPEQLQLPEVDTDEP